MEKILRYFTENKLLINLTIIFIIIAGLLSSSNIKREVFPPTDMETMIIIVKYPGASASDVELNAVVPIEEELGKINGIEEYTSLSIESGATLFATIDHDIEDTQSVKDEIFRNISKSNIEDIPDEVDEIKVLDANPKLRPVFSIGITPKDPDKTSDRELFEFAEYLEDRISRLDGVNDVDKNGYLDREIHIDVIPDKMNQHYISLNDIVKSIQARNIRATGGTLQSLDKEKTIVTIGQFDDPMDVKGVIIRSGFEQKRVKIRDIGKIRDDFEKEYVRIKVNREKAVVLTVKKKENADVVKTVNNIKNFLNENEEKINQRFNITLVHDDSESIISLLNVVLSNAAIGFILVLIILFIFLDLKTSFWTAFSIPVCMFIVIIYMYIYDFSINIITLGAIITVLGMMVDDAIVIAEVIYERKESGMEPVEAAVSGVKRIIKPVTVTILSTIVAFLPMLTIKGMMGKFIYVYPIVITVTLLASLFEATFMLPNHLAHSRPARIKKDKNWFKQFIDFYEVFLKTVLKFRYIIILLFISLFAAVIFISRDTIKNFVLIWDDSSDRIYINMEAPRGTSLELTERLTSEVEDVILKRIPEEELVSIFTKIGEHTVSRRNSKGNHENWSQVLIQLVPRTERKRAVSDIIEDLRRFINIKTLNKFEKIFLVERSFGPPTGEAVDIKIVYKNDNTAKKLQREIEEYLSVFPGIEDIDNDQKEGKRELKVKFNYEKLAQFGMTVDSVAKTVRTAYEGTVATSIQTTENKIDFRVKIDDSYQKDRKFLMNLLIPNNQGRLVKLKEIAEIVTREGRTLINHYNGNRVITITANVDEDITTSGIVTQKIKKRFQEIKNKYPDSYLIFGGKAKERQKAIGGLKNAFFLAFLLIYFIIVLLFRSLSQPFLVIISIPFGVIGALLAFTAHGIPLSFMGVIGIIGLCGIVINDNIIMVDFINRVFSENTGDDKSEIVNKIAEGAKQRLRPVILTTVTTSAALLPTVYGIGGDAKMLVPTVMAIAYGILFDCLLTLILIPSLYMIHTDIKLFFNRIIKLRKT